MCLKCRGGIRCIFLLIAYWLWLQSEVEEQTLFITPCIFEAFPREDKIKKTK